MTAILFVVGCIGFVIVVAWAYAVASVEAGSSGVGLLAMVESAPPSAKETCQPPRWTQKGARKRRIRMPIGKPDSVRPAMRTWPRRRGSA